MALKNITKESIIQTFRKNAFSALMIGLGVAVGNYVGSNLGEFYNLESFNGDPVVGMSMLKSSLYGVACSLLAMSYDMFSAYKDNNLSATEDSIESQPKL